MSRSSFSGEPRIARLFHFIQICIFHSLISFLSCYGLDTPAIDKINSKSDRLFSSLVTLHTLNASQCVNQLATKNPIESPIVNHTNSFFFDPFECIHFDIEKRTVDCEDDLTWNGGVKGDEESLLPDGYGTFDLVDGCRIETCMVDGKKHGWTVTKYDSGALKEECCYMNGKQHGMVKKYKQNKEVTYSSYYNGEKAADAFGFGNNDNLYTNNNEIVIDSDLVYRYKSKTNSKGLHPIVFSKDVVKLQCCPYIDDDLLLVGAVLKELKIEHSNGYAYHSVVISHLPRLEKVIVKPDALSNIDANGMFRIEYCESLQIISIKRNACRYYSSLLLKGNCNSVSVILRITKVA